MATLSSTLLVYPSTLNHCLLLNSRNHHKLKHKLCCRKPAKFPISFQSEHKFDKNGTIPVLINKFEPEPDAQEEHDDIGVKAALSVLKFYKREISPLLPRSCRYVPTCSEYSMIAYKRYGFVKGSVLTVWRVCRCNPLGGSGFDPPHWFDEERPPVERD